VRQREARSTALLTRITSLRIALVPAVMVLVLLGDRVRYAYVGAAVVFVAAAATDFVDGYLARRWALTTALGAFLDTTADKLLVAGAFVALVAAGRASPWVAAIVIGRELAILGLRGVVAVEGIVMEASGWGKLKANAQYVAITLAMLRLEEPLARLYLDQWAMLIAAVVTVLSAWDYWARWSSLLASDRR
jgi:CDP-diacylglycerol--glycerol-3-phosphate 3-phosphatidyltransferase